MRYRSVEYALTKLFNTAREEPLQPVHVELTPEGTLGSGTRPMSIDEWLELPIDEAHPVIRMTRDRKMKVPLVIITPSCHKLPRVKIQLNKRGLFLRDKGLCGYCNKHLTLDESTIDHIIPKDHGGQHTWINTVLSCGPCNNKKANRTPKQAGMILTVIPKEPGERPMHPGVQCPGIPEHRALLGE